MIPEIEQHREAIISLCKEFGVERLYLFGSATSSEYDASRSDIDFLVFYPDGYEYGPFGERYLALQDRLARLLDLPVDLVMARNLRNPVFLQSLRSTRQLLYAA